MSTGREPSPPSTSNGGRPDAGGHRFPVAWSPSPSQRAAARHAAYQPIVNRAARQMLVLVKAVAPGVAHWFDLHLPLVGVQTVTLPGGSSFRVRVNETSHSSTSALCRRGFGAVEPDVAPVFAALAARSDVVLDVGANIGVYAMAAAVLNPEAEVVAFEPLPDVYERLLANALLNGLEHVICVNAAVSDGAGAATLFAPAGRVATTASQEVSHRLRHPNERAHEPGPYACHIVPTVDLDDFVELAQLARVDLVKIDVEQAELTVLQGMTRIVAADRPHIICELFPESWIQRDVGAEIEALLAPHDYFFYLLTDQGLQHCPHISGHPEHPNHLFTPLAPHELAELIDRPVEV
jgi:FkbM family methyltransferase